jgi:hypothetical protein
MKVRWTVQSFREAFMPPDRLQTHIDEICCYHEYSNWNPHLYSAPRLMLNLSTHVQWKG